MRYQDALGRLAVAIQQVSEAQVAEKGMLVRDHEAVETKPKAEEQEKIDIRPRGPSDRLGAQQEPGDHAKMRRVALEARTLEHCEGLLQGILDENI